jgi:glutamyl-tRNA synthetase
MKITHVIRGDDHVNNTPRQINIFRALGQEPPVYAHLPTVLNEEGEKMSKRHGAKAVTWYRDAGFLADGVVNYLARLGWSHGDDEIFTREQFIQWFDLDHLGKSAAQYDEAKLRWVNAQHMKLTPDAQLALFVEQLLKKRGVKPDSRLQGICGLFKDRCDTLLVLADWAQKFYGDVRPDPEELAKLLTEPVKPAVAMLARMLADCPWTKDDISQAIKEVLRATGVKMPQLAMPVRVLVLGTAQTPSLDATLALCDRDTVVERLAKAG